MPSFFRYDMVWLENLVRLVYTPFVGMAPGVVRPWPWIDARPAARDAT